MVNVSEQTLKDVDVILWLVEPTTYIGAGGLGTLIFTGLGLYDMTYVIIGGVSVAILALLSMVGFDFLIRRARRYDEASYSI